MLAVMFVAAATPVHAATFDSAVAVQSVPLRRSIPLEIVG
jgi:hypothetical protein